MSTSPEDFKVKNAKRGGFNSKGQDYSKAPGFSWGGIRSLEVSTLFHTNPTVML